MPDKLPGDSEAAKKCFQLWNAPPCLRVLDPETHPRHPAVHRHFFPSSRFSTSRSCLFITPLSPSPCLHFYFPLLSVFSSLLPYFTSTTISFRPNFSVLFQLTKCVLVISVMSLVLLPFPPRPHFSSLLLPYSSPGFTPLPPPPPLLAFTYSLLIPLCTPSPSPPPRTTPSSPLPSAIPITHGDTVNGTLQAR